MTTSVHRDGNYSGIGGYQEPSDVLNIGLLQSQLMFLHMGIALFLAGLLGIYVAALRDSMIRAGTAKAEAIDPGNWI